MGMYMRKGYCKKKALTVISGLVFLSMVLCSCDSSAGKTSEHNSTESITESVPESSISSTDARKEEFPFDGMENLTCHEYDEENILGLSAIYVGEQMLVFCFQDNDLWRNYKERHDEIEVRGLTDEGRGVSLLGYTLEESTHFFWVRVEDDNKEEVAGFALSSSLGYYSVRGLINPQLNIREKYSSIIKGQAFENDCWGEVFERDLAPVIIPN